MSSVEELLHQAQEFANVFEFERAMDILVKSSGLGPLLNTEHTHNPHLPSLLLFASIAIELEAIPEAVAAYELAIKAFPDDPNAYALLAPLIADPLETLSLYTLALEKLANSSSLSASQIHCAIAELWITDLCTESEADEKAEYHLIEASKEPSKNGYEINYLFSQLYLNTNNRAKATEHFEKVFDDFEPSDSSFEVLFQIAKLGLELSSFEKAITLLNEAIEMKDDSPDAHYLLGFAILFSSSSGKTGAFSLEVAEEHLTIAKKNDSEFKDMLAHIDELLHAHFSRKDTATGDNDSSAKQKHAEKNTTDKKMAK